MIDIGAALLWNRIKRTDPAPTPRPDHLVKRDDLLQGMVGPAPAPERLQMTVENGYVTYTASGMAPVRKSDAELRRERFSRLPAPVQRVAFRGLTLGALELLAEVVKEHSQTGRAVSLDTQRCSALTNLPEKEAAGLLRELLSHGLIFKAASLETDLFLPSSEVRC